jgi:hypothetical protein
MPSAVGGGPVGVWCQRIGDDRIGDLRIGYRVRMIGARWQWVWQDRLGFARVRQDRCRRFAGLRWAVRRWHVWFEWFWAHAAGVPDAGIAKPWPSTGRSPPASCPTRERLTYAPNDG